MRHPVLATVSRGYLELGGRLPTRYSPVRRFTQGLPPFHARLACIRRAASVRPEPGSNSPVKSLLLKRSLKRTRVGSFLYLSLLLLSFQ